MKTRVSGIRLQVHPTDPLDDRMRGTGCRLHVHGSDDENARPHRHDNFRQVLGRFAAFTVERGSVDGKILCTPWQDAQLATLCDPSRAARP